MTKLSPVPLRPTSAPHRKLRGFKQSKSFPVLNRPVRLWGGKRAELKCQAITGNRSPIKIPTQRQPQASRDRRRSTECQESDKEGRSWKKRRSEEKDVEWAFDCRQRYRRGLSMQNKLPYFFFPVAVLSLHTVVRLLLVSLFSSGLWPNRVWPARVRVRGGGGSKEDCCCCMLCSVFSKVL